MVAPNVAQVPGVIVALVDRKTPSWYGAWSSVHSDAFKIVFSVLPPEGMPDEELALLRSSWTINHTGRLHLICYLWGNGIDPDTIRKVLAPLVRLASYPVVNNILGSLKARTYDNTWFYFSVRYQIRLFLNDEVQESLNDYSRYKIAHYEFERRLDRCCKSRSGWPTAAQTKHFFAKYGVEYSH
jgi:hypothetical protein